ncbi:MAG: D-alanyl-D-alanine carboxypeptidase/D-alanyl-D-alanine-endopeptidase [Prevotella sp.]|nr:D-alanyl-D-alanine carboxypeptidase/D-alanyl-D-alanine-endopeptidase [Prevotella sp.]
MIVRVFKLFLLVMLVAVTPVMAQTDDTVVDNDESNTPDSVSVDTTHVMSSLPWPQNIKVKLDKLMTSKMFETSQLGMEIYDLTDDSVIYKINENMLLRPASTMKLITAITAIDKLGGSYQFRTSLYYTGKISNKTLNGDLYCVGGFDPRFNSDDMNAFVESLHRMGVDTIRGRLCGDLSMKDTAKLGEGWCWDDENPTLTPLLISRKDLFMDRFRQALLNDSVHVDAITSTGALPNGAFSICTRFHTIDQILMNMMKESDNLYAESMFYQIAASTGNRPATARSARAIIRQLIKKVGLDPRGYRIADGSGLSLYNYISPELEIRFLKYAYDNSNIYLHLYPSLPIAGQDGTLKNRMRGSFTDGNVHAKTGTVTGISSLSGYCTASNGHKLCFCIINQGLLHGKNGRAFQDRVCSILCQP